MTPPLNNTAIPLPVELRRQIAQLRAARSRERATAMLPVPDRVLGFPVLPLTPASLSRLTATANPLITGGPVREAHLCDYLWFHSPLYCDDTHPRFAARYRRATAILRHAALPRWRRWLGQTPGPNQLGAALALAQADIVALITAAFADAPAPGGSASPPIATLEAQMIHRFCTAYGWPPERTSATPLRVLFQLIRCQHADHGAPAEDPAEDRLKAAHYAALNAALAPLRAQPQATS